MFITFFIVNFSTHIWYDALLVIIRNPGLDGYTLIPDAPKNKATFYGLELW